MLRGPRPAGPADGHSQQQGRPNHRPPPAPARPAPQARGARLDTPRGAAAQGRRAGGGPSADGLRSAGRGDEGAELHCRRAPGCRHHVTPPPPPRPALPSRTLDTLKYCAHCGSQLMRWWMFQRCTALHDGRPAGAPPPRAAVPRAQALPRRPSHAGAPSRRASTLHQLPVHPALLTVSVWIFLSAQSSLPTMWRRMR